MSALTAANLVRLGTPSSQCAIDATRGGLVESLSVDGIGDLLWTPAQKAGEGGGGVAPSGFPGHGIPFCFPWAGRVWVDGQVGRWRLGDSVLSMPIHGMMGNATCEVVQTKSTSAECRVAFAEGQRPDYPFTFTIEHRYNLRPDGLSWTVRVRRSARCAQPHMMPVALGWHPYVRLDAVGADAVLAIDARAAIEVTAAGGAGMSHPRDFSQPVSVRDAALRSVIVGDLRESRAVLWSPSSGRFVEMTFGPAGLFQQVVLWTKPDSGFFCVEPWMGLPDAVHSGAGVRWLNPGEMLDATVTFAAGMMPEESHQ